MNNATFATQSVSHKPSNGTALNLHFDQKSLQAKL